MGPMDSERTIFEGFEGIRLVADVRGEPAAWPVLFLHGGGQTRFAWGRTAEIVAEEMPGVHISCSYQVLPRAPEYDRTSTTVVDAYLSPILRRCAQRYTARRRRTWRRCRAEYR